MAALGSGSLSVNLPLAEEEDQSRRRSRRCPSGRGHLERKCSASCCLGAPGSGLDVCKWELASCWLCSSHWEVQSNSPPFESRLTPVACFGKQNMEDFPENLVFTRLRYKEPCILPLRPWEPTRVALNYHWRVLFPWVHHARRPPCLSSGHQDQLGILPARVPCCILQGFIRSSRLAHLPADLLWPPLMPCGTKGTTQQSLAQNSDPQNRKNSKGNTI